MVGRRTIGLLKVFALEEWGIKVPKRALLPPRRLFFIFCVLTRFRSRANFAFTLFCLSTVFVVVLDTLDVYQSIQQWFVVSLPRIREQKNRLANY